MTDASQTDDAWNTGLDWVDKVYGAGSRAMMAGMDETPFVSETVRNLFGKIWSTPGLSVRDKRLLVIGASTMLGRADLLAIQIAGAIVNGELDDQQLDELPQLMMFYAGAGNTTALYQGILQAKAKAKDMKPAG